MLKSLFESRNGGLVAAISGIVLVFVADCITKSGYSVHADKESIEVTAPDTAESDKKSVDKTDDMNPTSKNE